MLESLIFSIISVAVTYGIAHFSIGFLDPYMGVVFGETELLSTYFSSHLLLILGIEFVSVFLLTIVSSGLAMRRYLRT